MSQAVQRSTKAGHGKTAAVVSAGRAYLLLAVVIVLWGANWPVIKVGVTLMPPLWFAFAAILLGEPASLSSLHTKDGFDCRPAMTCPSSSASVCCRWDCSCC